MSSAPEEVPGPDNVVPMKQALEEMYAEAVEWDNGLHRFMRRLKARIHALDLAEDPTFHAEATEARKTLFGH